MLIIYQRKAKTTFRRVVTCYTVSRLGGLFHASQTRRGADMPSRRSTLVFIVVKQLLRFGLRDYYSYLAGQFDCDKSNRLIAPMPVMRFCPILVFMAVTNNNKHNKV